MRNVLCVLAVVALFQANALAGGGGSKATAKILVTNYSQLNAAVIVDPPAGTNPDNFAQRGGKILGPGGGAWTFKVKAGTHVVWANLANDNGLTGDPATMNVTVAKNKTLKVAVFDFGGDADLELDSH